MPSERSARPSPRTAPRTMSTSSTRPLSAASSSLVPRCAASASAPARCTDTFALIRNRECWLIGVHIHPHSHGSIFNRDPDRRRKLLLHRKEIDYLDGKLRNRGYALVPLELYFDDNGRVKLLLGWVAVKSSTTSARIWRSAICSARSTGPSRRVADSAYSPPRRASTHRFAGATRARRRYHCGMQGRFGTMPDREEIGMDMTAFFTMSYGLYVVSATAGDERAGCGSTPRRR